MALNADPMQTGESPWWMNVMEQSPGTVLSTNFTAWRGSNTILRGGYARKGRSPGMFRSNNPLRPANWGRYGNQDVFDSSAKYSPFGFVNSAAGAAAKRGFLGEAAQEAAERGDDVVGRGALSRAVAAEKAGIRGAGLRTKGLNSFLTGEGSVMRHVGSDFVSTASKQELRQATYGTLADKALTGRVSGYMASAKGPISGRVMQASEQGTRLMWDKGAGKYVERQGAKNFFRLGSEAFTKDLAKAGFASAEKATARGLMGVMAKGGAESGARLAAGKILGAKAAALAIPGLNVAMTAWMAYDVAKMTMGLGSAAIKGSVKLATDAYKSFNAGINRPLMGAGTFQETEASMTSRQRGVMAISNSRLNARSILGAEAGGMHAHFG